MNADIKWLDNPEVFQMNRLNAHSDHRFYPGKRQMEEGKNPLC